MPTLADHNSSSMIAFCGMRFGIEAALAHGLPAVIGWRAFIPAMPVSWLSRWMGIAVRAFTAAGSLPCGQFSTFKSANVSTVALDEPVRSPFMHVRKAKDDQMSVSASCFVGKTHALILAWVR